mmetsp:Transcript_32719/g.110190  ORF Transcript_32719/g.110190 Transcript_32719/m.110190 type:complete len:214 (-) Transcript_32719:618-1259(-)
MVRLKALDLFLLLLLLPIIKPKHHLANRLGHDAVLHLRRNVQLARVHGTSFQRQRHDAAVGHLGVARAQRVGPGGEELAEEVSKIERMPTNDDHVLVPLENPLGKPLEALQAAAAEELVAGIARHVEAVRGGQVPRHAAQDRRGKGQRDGQRVDVRRDFLQGGEDVDLLLRVLFQPRRQRELHRLRRTSQIRRRHHRRPVRAPAQSLDVGKAG